jgi:hypothetical protein
VPAARRRPSAQAQAQAQAQAPPYHVVVGEPPSSARLFRLHAGLVAAVSISASAFGIEIVRAIGGNTLSWAYVFEWPLLGGYSIYMWRRLVREERGTAAPRPVARPADGDEVALAAWNRYLADLHAFDAASKRSHRST